MPSTFFISDIHLDASRPELTQSLEAFLHRHGRCDALYILGDLFEAWIGDDDDADLGRETARMLREFCDRGPALYLMHGNRDFLLGEDFCHRTGALLLPDPTVIDLYGTRTLLMHGDSLCTADTHYQQFRQQSRTSAWQHDVLRHSVAKRRELAVELRAISRDSVSNKAEDIVDVTPAEVNRVMVAHGVRRLIHGHTHRPARHQVDAGDRWVLGDWGELGWAIEASAGGLLIFNFPI